MATAAARAPDTPTRRTRRRPSAQVLLNRVYRLRQDEDAEGVVQTRSPFKLPSVEGGAVHRFYPRGGWRRISSATTARRPSTSSGLGSLGVDSHSGSSSVSGSAATECQRVP